MHELWPPFERSCPMGTELQDRLRRGLAELAEATPVTLPLASFHASLIEVLPSRRPDKRRVVLLGAAALVVCTVAGVVAFDKIDRSERHAGDVPVSAPAAEPAW